MTQNIPRRPRLAIAGGGLAGIAAAESVSRLAPTCDVTLFEAKRRLGGRAGSYTDPKSGTEIDYCQHVAMGCCTNLIDLLQRCGADNAMKRYEQLSFLHPEFPPSRFEPNRHLPAPLHLLGTIGAMRFLDKRQQREIRKALWRMIRDKRLASPSARKDDPTPTAAEWLFAAGQSRDTIRDFWNVILVSALGEHTDRVSIRAARKVMVDGFASAFGASDVLVPTIPLSKLFGERVASEIASRGVHIRTGDPVRRIGRDGTVETASDRQVFDYVICAVPWHKVESVFSDWEANDRPLLPPLERYTAFPSSPITGIHLWLDRPISELDHAALVGLNSQWLFRPTETSVRSQPDEHYHQVVISGEFDRSKEDLISTVLSDLRRVFPAATEARLIRHQIVTDPNSVFSVRPDVDAARPDAETGLEFLYLAGDWTKTGWPATMEGAIISGRNAAAGVLAAAQRRFGLPIDPRNGPTISPPLPAGALSRALIRRG